MDTGVMVHKANQITLFFTSYSREEAIAGVAETGEAARGEAPQREHAEND